ncbi:MAG: SpoIIE family protein phosphatase [Bacteroidales bacterium]
MAARTPFSSNNSYTTPPEAFHVLQFKWKLFFGFLTFALIVLAFGAIEQWFFTRPVLGFTAAAIMSLAPAFFIASRLNHPVRVIHEGIRRVAAGDLDVVIPHPRTRDEFEPLIDQFNAMVVSLRETQQLRESLARQEEVERGLREAGERLEARVRERTAELERAISERDRYVMHSLDLICVATLDGCYRSVNPAFERVLGHTTDELTSGPFMKYVHPDDVASTRVELERLAAGMPTVLFENRYRCKDGAYKHLEWTAIPLPEEQVVYAIARDITDRRRAEAAEQALMAASLQMRIAQHIQASLLPAECVHFEGFDIAGVSRPAESVGGDYFDCIPMSGSRTMLTIGDASGHGLSAALVMAQLHACLWSLLVSEPHEMDEVMQRANALLYAKTPSNVYATAIMVLLDPVRHALSHINCGHPPGYILSEAGCLKTKLGTNATPLGCFAQFCGEKGPWVPLACGDTLVLVTDGILEATSRDGEYFGDNRMLECVKAHRAESARAIAEAVQQEAAAFAGDVLADDATLLVMKVTG